MKLSCEDEVALLALVLFSTKCILPVLHPDGE